MRGVLLNAPDAFRPALRPLPDDVEIVEDSDDAVDYVHVFALNADQLNALLPDALRLVVYDGLLWISWPKASSGVETDLDRDLLTAALGELGYRPVREVSVSDVWSALRVRPRDAGGA
jgi:hypothetical protein